MHWYGGDFRTGPAVQQLESYLQATYARYHLPIWLTEFALTSYSGGTATFPTEAQQAAFLTAATKMLDGLSYVQRYAWFALPTSSGSGTTGLFNPSPWVTQSATPSRRPASGQETQPSGRLAARRARRRRRTRSPWPPRAAPARPASAG